MGGEECGIFVEIGFFLLLLFFSWVLVWVWKGGKPGGDEALGFGEGDGVAGEEDVGFGGDGGEGCHLGELGR